MREPVKAPDLERILLPLSTHSKTFQTSVAVLPGRYQHVPTLLLSLEALASTLDKAMVIPDPDLIGIAELGNGEGVLHTANRGVTCPFQS